MLVPVVVVVNVLLFHLISRMAVYSHHQELHHVVAKEFIDSPEFESAVSGDEKYQVRVI